MRILCSACACLCPIAIAATVLASWAAASEQVQTSFTVDANTTALYLFREGTGTTVHHEPTTQATQTPDATLNGANWTTGRQYYAVATDAGYMTIPDSTTQRPSTAITVEIWVKLDEPDGDVVVKEQVFFFRLGSTVTCSLAVGSSSWTTFVGTLPIPTRQWTHLAITFDSTTHVASIYVNGVLDTTYTCPSGTLNQATSTVWVGRNDYNSGSAVCGKIDSLRISKVARKFLPLPSPTPTPIPVGNLVPNGDFEMGLTGWRGDNYGDVNLMWETTGGAFSGQKCLHTLSSARTDFSALLGGGTPSGVYSRPIPARPGRQYTLSLQLKTSSGTYSPRVEIEGLGSSISDVSPFPIYPTVGTSWTQATQTFVLPSNFAPPNICVHIGYPSSGDFYVDDVRLICGGGPINLALKDMISVGPAAALPPGNVCTTGSSSPITLNIVNTDTVAHNVTVQPTITDWQGLSISGVPSLGTFSVPANGVTTVSYTMDTTHRGSCRLGFNLTSEGQTWHQSAEVQYAMVVNMQGVGNAATSIFAMNMHLDREPSDHLVRETQVLAQCGVKWIRAWWGWGMCENPEGTYSFTEYDRQYNAINGAQMNVMPVLLPLLSPVRALVGRFGVHRSAAAVLVDDERVGLVLRQGGATLCGQSESLRDLERAAERQQRGHYGFDLHSNSDCGLTKHPRL